MALREVVQIGDEILRARAGRVRRFGAELAQLLNDMLETMLAAEGIGLAAPQVGLSQRVIIVRLADDEASAAFFGDQAGILYEVVNPKIIRTSPELTGGVEGCLSIPGYQGQVPRHTVAVIRGQDRYGRAIRITARGWLARVFQHEVDHLDGILFIDRATEIWQVDEKALETAL